MAEVEQAQENTEWPPCSDVGPEPYPGSKPYLCTLEHGHTGRHEHWAGESLKQSWGRDGE